MHMPAVYLMVALTQNT